MDDQDNQNQSGPDTSSVIPEDTSTDDEHLPESDEEQTPTKPNKDDDQEDSGGRKLSRKDLKNLKDRYGHKGKHREEPTGRGQRGYKGKHRTASRVGKAGKAAKAGGQAGMAATRGASLAAAPESAGISLAIQAALELARKTWQKYRQWRRKGTERFVDDSAKSAQKWAIGCTAAFTFTFLIIIPLAISLISIFLFPPSSPQNASAPVTSGETPSTGVARNPNINESACKNVRAEISSGISGRYCKMPFFPSGNRFWNARDLIGGPPDGSYKFLGRNDWNTYGPQVWGSEDLINVLYTVSQWWKYGHTFADGTKSPPHPNGYLIIRDMTSPYHSSHKWGSTADILASTDGSDCVASYAGSCSRRYNTLATVQLGKLIVDTGYMHTILHNAIFKLIIYTDSTGHLRITTVNKAISDYAKLKYPNKFLYHSAVQWVIGHDDHFHLYIDRVQQNNNSNIIDRSKLLLCSSVGGVGCRYGQFIE